jgi:hypothetical protein
MNDRFEGGTRYVTYHRDLHFWEMATVCYDMLMDKVYAGCRTTALAGWADGLTSSGSIPPASP